MDKEIKNIKISFLITAYKEAGTVGRVIECLADRKHANFDNQFEILLACPDMETKNAAFEKVKQLGIEKNFEWIKDLQKGKPTALNLLIKKAKGDILIFTDGDVFFDKGAVGEIIEKMISNGYDLASGRPVSGDPKDNFMGYWGNLLADAAHHKRTVELTPNPSGRSTKLVKKAGFFPVSGYIWAMDSKFVKKLLDELGEIFPAETLVDDAYISYVVHNRKGKIGYIPDAKVFVKYPTNLSDYFKQKKRSTGGYVQLWDFGVVSTETKSRSFGKELEYFWFPFRYAKNLKQLIWSTWLFPVRLWLWVMIFWERRVIKKDFVKTWVRVDSTK